MSLHIVSGLNLIKFQKLKENGMVMEPSVSLKTSLPKFSITRNQTS
jgi:hypothetical protein